MKIYTKTGDQGETGLAAGGRIPKDDNRLHAYGTIDELNALMGVILTTELDDQLKESLERIQSELFELGADLSTPLETEADWVLRVQPQSIEQLEREIDEFSEALEPLKHFILPGGTPAAAYLQQARTICRRAERWMVSIKSEINPQTLVYTNRLSDWLFVAARLANARAGVSEPKWITRKK